MVKKPAPYDMSSKKAWSADDTFLRCVYLAEGERDGNADNKDVEIRLVCNLCSSEMGDLVKKGRFLPLPSVDWQVSIAIQCLVLLKYEGIDILKLKLR